MNPKPKHKWQEVLECQSMEQLINFLLQARTQTTWHGPEYQNYALRHIDQEMERRLDKAYQQGKAGLKRKPYT